MSSKVRIGFVGVGGMGQMAHLRNYAVLDECEVVAIAEVRQNTARRVAQRYHVPKIYRTHEELLAHEKLDAIVASQQFRRHGILVPELLKAGIPVFMEKPLSGSLQYGEKILDAVKKSDTWMMIGYHKRSDPATMYAKAEVDRLKQTGELGALKYIRSLMPAGDWIANGFTGLINEKEGDLPPFDWEKPAPDMDKATFDAYTAFVNYYIHQVNILRHFLSEDYHATYADPSGVLLCAESDSGVCVTIEMSPYCTTIDWQEHVLVCFERGWVRVDLPAPMVSNQPGVVEIYRDPGNGAVPTRTVPTLPHVHAMDQQARNFVAAVKGECPPMCGPEDALKDLQVAREYIRLRYGK